MVAFDAIIKSCVIILDASLCGILEYCSFVSEFIYVLLVRECHPYLSGNVEYFQREIFEREGVVFVRYAISCKGRLVSLCLIGGI